MADRRVFHEFVTVTLRKELIRRYKQLEILSEADMQAFVWRSMEKFLQTKAVNAHMYQVANRRYVKNLRVFPDILVLRRGKPWACIELKEKSFFVPRLIEKDWQRLVEDKEKLGIRRGYFIHLAGHGDFGVFKNLKKTRGLLYVTVRMCDEMPATDFAKWHEEYQTRSKLVVVSPSPKKPRPAKLTRAAAASGV
jgi:hypothetical protein